MATRPKRTSELKDSSTKKTSRISRIAQPINRISRARESGRRSSSVDCENNRDPFLQSAIKQRSSSAIRTSATPLKTPLRPIQPTNNGMFTSEKGLVEDKKWVQFQVNRLNEYVKDHIPDIGEDLNSKGGIKSMTTRQFIYIISHFITLAAGNKFKITNNTYVDDVIKILPQIGYPYNINKSSLKTINAPHSFSHIVVLLSWFLDFATYKNSINDVENENNMVGWENDFPSKSYTKYFIDHAKAGFALWNNSDDNEFDNLKSRLIDNFIYLKSNEKFSNLNEIEQHIGVITNEYETLVKNRVIIKNEENLKEVMDQCNLIDLNIKKINNYINDKNLEIKTLTRNIRDNNEIVNELNQQLYDHELIVKDQKMNVTERNAKLDEINMKNLVINTKIKSINELEDMSMTNQMIYSALIKKKLDLITTAYNLLIKLELKLSYFKDEINHLINQFNNNFKLGNSISNTNLIIQFLEEIKKLNELFANQQNCYREKSVSLQKQLNSLQTRNTVLGNDLNELNSKLEIAKQFYKSQLDKLLNDIVENDKLLKEVNLTMIYKSNNITVLKTSINKYMMDQKQITQSINELKENAITNADKIVNENVVKLNKLTTIFKEIDNLFEDIDDFI